MWNYSLLRTGLLLCVLQSHQEDSALLHKLLISGVSIIVTYDLVQSVVLVLSFLVSDYMDEPQKQFLNQFLSRVPIILELTIP